MKPIQIYGPSNLKKFIFGFSFLLTLSVAILLIYVVLSDNFKPGSDGKNLVITSFIILFALMILFGFLLFKHLNKPKFSLFENGVRINNGNLIPLETISDVYFFITGHKIGNNYNTLAFRISKNDSWNIISPDYSGNLNFFLDLHFNKRVPFLEKELQKENSIKFNYITDRKIDLLATGASYYVNNIKTATIELSNKHITIDGRIYEYRNLKPLYMDNNKFEIKTLANHVLLDFTYMDMITFDVFREIYNKTPFQIKEFSSH